MCALLRPIASTLTAVTAGNVIDKEIALIDVGGMGISFMRVMSAFKTINKVASRFFPVRPSRSALAPTPVAGAADSHRSGTPGVAQLVSQLRRQIERLSGICKARAPAASCHFCHLLALQERTLTVFILNAPRIFTSVWGAVRLPHAPAPAYDARAHSPRAGLTLARSHPSHTPTPSTSQPGWAMPRR